VKALIEAIVTKFNATSALDAIDGPWVVRAPKDKSLPYCVFMTITGQKPVEMFGSTYLEPVPIRFKIIGVDAPTLAGYQDSLHTAFDRYSLLTGSDKILTMNRDGQWLDTFFDADENGEEVFQAISDYECVVQRTR
jgi:hypothetical protein